MSRFTNVAEFNGISLYSGDKSVDGFAEEILAAMERQLLNALERHSQVLVAIMTVNFPGELEATAETRNRCFQHFIQEYSRRLRLKGFDPHYVWVREIGEHGQLHYHLALLLDGNAIRYFRSPTEVNAYWTNALLREYVFNGTCCVNLASFNGSHSLMVHKGDQAAYAEAMGRMSYLAKLFSKWETGANCRCWSQSHL